VNDRFPDAGKLLALEEGKMAHDQPDGFPEHRVFFLEAQEPVQNDMVGVFKLCLRGRRWRTHEHATVRVGGVEAFSPQVAFERDQL